MITALSQIHSTKHNRITRAHHSFTTANLQTGVAGIQVCENNGAAPCDLLLVGCCELVRRVFAGQMAQVFAKRISLNPTPPFGS